MIVFHADLDNTLIYSYKRDIGGSKQCVEIYEGREVSFMTSYTATMLRRLREILCFVPTTTRTEEQYNRIDFESPPEYALVCNGGILLKNGTRDEGWYQESLQLIADSMPQLERAVKILEKDENRIFEIRMIADLFVFTKSAAPEQSVEILRNLLNKEKVDIFYNGSKVYVTPCPLNKGKAVQRLKERLSPDFVIAAGDSQFDIPMFCHADLSYLPKELAGNRKLKKNMVVFSEGKVFSDEIINDIMKVIEK